MLDPITAAELRRSLEPRRPLMQPSTQPVLSGAARIRPRTALVASADRDVRQRMSHILTGLRWQVREASGGAEAWAEAEASTPEAVIVDTWLPDLDYGEFLITFEKVYPEVDLLTIDGTVSHQGARGAHRQELLYAIRQSQETDTAAWNTAPDLDARPFTDGANTTAASVDAPLQESTSGSSISSAAVKAAGIEKASSASERIPELIGEAPCMLEISRRIRLVAARSTPVLIEGPTGSGKELVAEALHRLSTRSRKPFVAINCAAIPEALLEAELFGHTRGAFTGAVQGRTGRIEAANGGTLFLDEIGEMPLSVQAKLLRFVQSGELQRVGDNETVKVDVRIVAATHCPLARQAQSGVFRADLYYRLAVFLIRTPALSEHVEDLPLLVEHFLEKMGRTVPVKRIDSAALAKLRTHSWPGNVRELEHVLERAAILAGDAAVLTSQEIDFGVMVN
jgi:DNA-binding NtrC family response regulator